MSLFSLCFYSVFALFLAANKGYSSLMEPPLTEQKRVASVKNSLLRALWLIGENLGDGFMW